MAFEERGIDTVFSITGTTTIGRGGEEGAVRECWVVETISAADRVSEGWDKRGFDISGMSSIL
jgi:hypothetical protein